jgi:predicted component of type VI protein secretion system
MAFLQVFFNGELKFTTPLQLTVTKIGRSSDNHLVINNRGVSGHHAVVLIKENLFYISDNKSTNGVFLNGCRISQARLFYGDEITIFKHKLKFVAVDLSTDTSDANAHSQNAIVEDQTVVINNAQLQTLLNQQRTQVPYLMQTGGKNHGQRWLIAEQNFDIGKNRACNLYIGGWFSPQLSAVISRQSDGYYLTPEKRGKVQLNNKPISGRVKLQNYDNLQVRGIDLTFYQPSIRDLSLL